MMRNGNRTILLNKQALLNKIRENKANHIIEYNEAVIAYKIEALKQLEELKKEVINGCLNIKLNLVTPINVEDNYNNIIEMFSWEIKDEVELTQDEFKEYTLDESQFSINSKTANSFYSRL